MGRPKNDTTKYEILRCATELFLEKGYTDAYVTTIAKTLGISTGLLTFWFPTKEHILAELVRELFAFQWESEKEETDSLTAYLYELAMIASVCEENPKARDLILAVYTHAQSIEIVRRYDTKRSQLTFKAYCGQWTEKDFVIAENAASGVERAMLVTANTEGITFEERVSGSLDAIMKIYDVTSEERKPILANVIASDYRTRGNHVFEEFCRFVGYKIMQRPKAKR